MRFSSLVYVFLFSIAVGVSFFQIHELAFAQRVTPQVPETSVASTATATNTEAFPDPRQIVSELTQSGDYPVELIVPSIKLDVPIVNVGVNAKGEMDVPDGKTNNVGWYKDGTIPGDTGSAVLDAHVYAAFKNLRYAKVGDDMYVKTKSGKFRHFRIEESTVYKTTQVPLQQLFNRADASRLNLITCAGTYVPSRGTYDKRLVVYAVLVDK